MTKYQKEVKKKMSDKKYEVKTINFGGKGHPARVLINKYCEKNGKQSLSPLIRKLVIVYLSKKQEYIDFKKELKYYEYIETKRSIARLAKKRYDLEQELGKLGVDYEI